jgi:hypothetical protein
MLDDFVRTEILVIEFFGASFGDNVPSREPDLVVRSKDRGGCDIFVVVLFHVIGGVTEFLS